MLVHIAYVINVRQKSGENEEKGTNVLNVY